MRFALGDGDAKSTKSRHVTTEQPIGTRRDAGGCGNYAETPAAPTLRSADQIALNLPVVSAQSPRRLRHGRRRFRERTAQKGADKRRATDFVVIELVASRATNVNRALRPPFRATIFEHTLSRSPRHLFNDRRRFSARTAEKDAGKRKIATEFVVIELAASREANVRFATPTFYFGDRSIVGEVPSSNIADATSRRPPPIGRERAASFAAAPKFRSGPLRRVASRGTPTLANRPTQRPGARGTRPELGAGGGDARTSLELCP